MRDLDDWNSKFDRDFDRFESQFNKAWKWSWALVAVSTLMSLAFCAAVIWAIIVLVNHFA